MLKPALFSLGFVVIAAAPAMAAQAPGSPKPAALAYDVKKLKEPCSFCELVDGDIFNLGPDGEIEFFHYENCKVVRSRGGVLSIYSFGYKLDGGEVLSAEDAPCPIIETTTSSSDRIGGAALLSSSPTSSDAEGVAMGRDAAFVVRNRSLSGSLLPDDGPAIALERRGDLLVLPARRRRLAPSAYRLVLSDPKGVTVDTIALEICRGGDCASVLKTRH